jgi:hypothetical protein
MAAIPQSVTRRSSAALANADVRPPRASLVNLATQDEYEFLFNPETLEETIEADYNRTEVIGLSHKRLGYKNTGNETIPIELYLSQLMQDVLAGRGGSRPYVATEQKRWLQSLVYPVESQDFSFVGPPQVLFIWPRVVRMKGKITKVSFLHKAFSPRTLATTQLVARLQFEEDVEQRRLMDDVLRLGSETVEREDFR